MVIVPVTTVQVGCATFTVGAGGVPGATEIVALTDKAEIQQTELVTVKLYIPGARPLTVVVVVFPVDVVPPGYIVSIQLPAGRFIRSMLPVSTVHVGCVIVPIAGG